MGEVYNYNGQESSVVGNEFKHKDTTREMKIRFFNKRGIIIKPNKAHKFIAKIGIESGPYVGDYPVTVRHDYFILETSKLVDLAPGNYRLEVWESYNDDNGKTHVGIFPTPDQFAKFTIHANIPDSNDEYVKDISFQDVIDKAVISAGLHLSVSAKSVDSSQNASVKQEYKNSQNYVEFSIPRGEDGKTWQPYINDDGNWHIRLISKGE